MRVGVRAFKNELSKYLRRVSRGETVEITSHGKTIARLAPPSPAPIESWIATEAETDEWPDFLSGRPLADEDTVRDVLEWMRGDR